MMTIPDRARLQTYFVQAFTLSVLFVMVYGTTNHLGSLSPINHHLWFDFELGIPLVPEFIFIYMSLNVLMLLPLFVLKVDKLKRLGLSMAVSILIAGVIFYYFPAPLGFVRPSVVPRYNDFFQFLYDVDNVANTFPSLHITLSFICTRSLFLAQSRLKWVWIWFLLICLSVVLTHQHHLADILGGLILGEFCIRKIYLNPTINNLFKIVR